MELNEFLSRLNNVKKSGSGYMAQCPVPNHNDKNPSLSIGMSEDGTKILINCFAGCTTDEILSAMGLKVSDLFIKQKSDKRDKQVVKNTPYHYYDVDGTLLYTKVRMDYDDGTKKFYFKQANGKNGVKDVKRVPYNLPDILEASKVYFVEGEKCADAVIKQGCCATTLDSGSNSKWLPEYNQYFAEKEVIIIPDNDNPGMKYAKYIAENIPEARIIPLPKQNNCMKKGYDIADWIEDGGVMENLIFESAFTNLEENKGQVESYATDVSSKRTQADILLEIVENKGIHLYVNQVKAVSIAVPIDGHTVVWSLDSSSFSEWLQCIFYRETGKPIRTEGVKQVISILTAKAKYESGENIVLFNRVAVDDNSVWYDLGNKAWQAIHITPDGWNVIDNPPVLFERYNHQKEQVIPEAGGDIRKIFRYINLKEYHVLFLCWLVSCFIPEFPHAMPIFYGEKGAAKSTACVLLKRLIDPSALETLTLPNDQRSLVVNLANHWYLPFDNVSSINADTSDTLCRAITGGGIQQRKLCTNAEDYIFSFQRCISINGINNVANRADLLDRSILFELVRVSEAERKELREIYNSFECDRASILGGIFDTLVKTIQVFDSVKLDKLPRMADFAKWGYAIGEALGGYGKQFLEEYEKNQKLRDFEAINSDIVATLIVAFMESRDTWTGYVSDLLVQIQNIAPSYGIDSKSRGMPEQPNALSRRMNTVKSNLSAIGITYTKHCNAKGTKIILTNSNISPLSPYRVDSGKTMGLNNGDKHGDKEPSVTLPPYKFPTEHKENGGNGDNGDTFTDDEDTNIEF